jgi:hypothetical protein
MEEAPPGLTRGQQGFYLMQGRLLGLSDREEQGPNVIEAHQDFVRHVEQGANRMRALSIATLVVSVVLAVSYISQLALPLAGTTEVTVYLTDPTNIAVELVVLGLALVWFYVGVRDYSYSTKMRRDISIARAREDEIRAKIPESPDRSSVD